MVVITLVGLAFLTADVTVVIFDVTAISVGVLAVVGVVVDFAFAINGIFGSSSHKCSFFSLGGIH